MSAVLERDLNAPDDSSPTFTELREETMQIISDGKSNDITDDVWADLENDWNQVLRTWFENRDDQLAFGIFMDDWIERHVNDNCYQARR